MDSSKPTPANTPQGTDVSPPPPVSTEHTIPPPPPPTATPPPPPPSGSPAPPNPQFQNAWSDDRQRQFRSPRLFLSFRDDDTGDMVAQLHRYLVQDFGPSAVYYYKHDNVAGQPWQKQLNERLEMADGVVALIGKDWVGRVGDGTLRIERSEDLVRYEIERSMADDSKPTPVPVLVDTSVGEINALYRPEQTLGLFTGPAAPHVIETSRSRLLNPHSVEYQRLLVGMWHSLTAELADSVLIIGEYAQADLEAFIDGLKISSAKRARHLTRVGSHVYAISKRQLRKRVARQEWPDVILLTDEEDEGPRFEALLAALDEHPEVRNIALVGVGALVGFGASSVASSSAELTTPTIHTNGSAFATSMSKTSLLVGSSAAVATATGAAVVVLTLPLPETLTFESVSLDESLVNQDGAEDDRLWPFGQPGDANVVLGPPEATNQVGILGDQATGYVRQSVVVELPGEDPIVLGEVVVPTELQSEVTENAEDGPLAVAFATGRFDLSFSKLEATNICFDLAEPNTIWGGTRFSGESVEVVVQFNAEIVESEVSKTFIQLFVQGPGELAFFDDEIVEGNTARCEGDARAVWSSE